LQEARLARNWTPELAARETKIKVDRLRDLEADDYSHFTSPTYARGFVRTYARSLGLDEYRILRQLDNKLPDDDSSNIVTETGVAYLPETAMPPRAAHRDYTGLYVLVGLGAVVTLAIVFVLFEAYRVGELSRYFGSSTEAVAAAAPTGTNASTAPAIPTTEPVARALPIDSNTPPPIADATPQTNAPAATNAVADPGPASAPAPAPAPGLASPRALPVDPSVLGAVSPDAPVQAVRALPVDPSELTAAAAVTPAPAPPSDSSGSPTQAATSAPPRALPVSPSELAAASSGAPGASAPVPEPTTLVAVNTPAVPAVTTPVPATGADAVPAPSIAVTAPSPAQSAPAAPVAPPVPMVAESATNGAPQTADPADSAADTGKRLVLTASQDSFVRVTNLDAQAEKPLYAAVLHTGQSVGFDGRKFSINVGIPSAIDIKLDGVNYGPHSDQEAPETFTVQSHVP